MEATKTARPVQGGKPPRKVRDLSVRSTADSAVTLAFTEVSDGRKGPASYEIRFQPAPLDWNAAERVSRGSCAAPLDGVAVGAERLCDVEGLEPAVRYEFQLVAYRGSLDGPRADGQVSNVATGTTAGGAIGGYEFQAFPDSLLLETLGDTAVVDALLTDASGQAVEDQLLWASSDSSVVTVDARGRVEAVRSGSAFLTVRPSCCDLADTVAAYVTDSAAPASSEPATVGNLAVVSASASSLTVSFTEVDDGTGAPADYDVRLMPTPLDWGSAESVAEGTCATPLAGSAVGAERTCVIEGLLAETDYEVQLVAFRGTMNVDAVYGPLSAIAAGTTTAPETTTPDLADECAQGGAGWIWCDDFETDRLASYFEYDDAGGRFAPSAGDGIDGSSAMRAEFLAGSTGAGNLKLAFGRTPDGYMDPVDDGTSDYREVYWRMFVRNEAGWTGGGGHKLSRATVFATGGWAQAAIGHVWTTDPDHEVLALDPASGTDTSGRLRATTYNDFPNLRWLGLEPSVTPLFDAAHVGSWYCVEARMRLNDAGASNGAFELWIDGELEASATDLNWVGAYDDYGINTIMFENYWNDGAPVDQVRYFDNIVVSTEPIGCGAGTAPPPSEPDPEPEPEPEPSAPELLRVSGNGQTGTVETTLPDPLVVRVVDAAGAAVGGETVAWAVTGGGGSVSRSTTTTDAQGYAQVLWTLGSTAGAGGVTASLADGSSVAFTSTAEAASEPGSSTTGQHEPPGFSRLTERSFGQLREDGWIVENSRGAAIVSDASAPVSNPVLRIEYPAGFRAGSSPVDLERSTGTDRANYLSLWLKLSDNFQGESSGTNKIFYNWIHGNPSFFFSAEGSGQGTLRPTVRLQNAPDSREYFFPNVDPDAELVRGRWHHLEFVMRANTPGVADGSVTWWLDGVRVGSYSDLLISGSGQSNRWQILEISPIWGGVSGTVDRTMHILMDHLYLSGGG